MGKCTTFKECYPYFKIPDLGILDGWVLGVYDSCSYLQSNGKAAFGICCADYQPTTPTSNLESEIPVENPDEVNKRKILFLKENIKKNFTFKFHF